MAGSAEKIKLLFKKYGKIALGVHLCVYGTFLTGGWLRRQGRKRHGAGKLCMAGSCARVRGFSSMLPTLSR